MQAAVAVCLVALSRLDPAAQLWWVALWAALLAAASATQDVGDRRAAHRAVPRAAEARQGRRRRGDACLRLVGRYGFGGGAALWLWSSCSGRMPPRPGSGATCC